MGKAEENKKIKRSALLTQAFSLFMNNGIANTSIADITSHAGVAKGTFYNFFKDKDDLIEKLIAQKTEKLFENTLAKLENINETLTVEDALVFVSNDLIEQLIADNKLLRFINKNLNYGIHKNVLIDMDENASEYTFIEKYHALLDASEYNWKEPNLMLYTIVELVSSTCHSIILDQQPVDYDHYRPYLEASIRSIVNVFKEKNEN